MKPWCEGAAAAAASAARLRRRRRLQLLALSEAESIAAAHGLAEPTGRTAAAAASDDVLVDDAYGDEGFVMVPRLPRLALPCEPMQRDTPRASEVDAADMRAEDDAVSASAWLPFGAIGQQWFDSLPIPSMLLPPPLPSAPAVTTSGPQTRVTSAPPLSSPKTDAQSGHYVEGSMLGLPPGLVRSHSKTASEASDGLIELSNCPPDRMTVLDSALATKLSKWLPGMQRLLPAWRLLYSSLIHGVSMQTMLDRAFAYPGPTVLVVKDTKGARFGGYASTAWRSETSFYGTGECFLWKEGGDGSLRVFQWSKRNDYFMLATQAKRESFIAMGGGEGDYALWLHESLLLGHSAATSTFRNEVLASKSDFDVSGVEMWGVGVDDDDFDDDGHGMMARSASSGGFTQPFSPRPSSRY